MKKEKLVKREITKLYITSKKNLTEKEICFFVSKNNLFPISIRKITNWNWIAEVEYEKHKELLSALKTSKLRDKEVSVKRVFKSIKLYKQFKEEPSNNFILQVIMGISGLIKKPINIKITNNRADDWQKLMTKMWQEELERPNIFKKAGIKPVIDIAPNGELEFCIVKSGNYVITYFNKLIDEYC